MSNTKYKNTDIGMLPSEWDIDSVGNQYLKARIGWQGLTTAEYLQSGDYYLVTGVDFDNGKIKWDNCAFVDKKRYSQDVNIQLKEKDILITKDGTIGKIAYIDMLRKPTTLNSGIFILRPKNENINNKYLYYILNSEYFNQFINDLCAGSTIIHLYQKDFVKFVFPVPQKNEQQKIATALTHIDNLINDYEKLIKKKEAIKKGMMQELLNNNKCDEYKISQLFVYRNGKSFENDVVKKGKYEIINLNSVSIKGNLKSSNKYTNKSDELLKKDDLVMILSDVGHGDLLGRVGIIPQNNRYVLNQRVALLRAKDKFDIRYVYYYINYKQKYFKLRGAGSSQLNISKNVVENFIVELPNIIKQNEIATKLNNIDSEIRLFETKLEKLKSLKKSMMSNLLTGKIRL